MNKKSNKTLKILTAAALLVPAARSLFAAPVPPPKPPDPYEEAVQGLGAAEPMARRRSAHALGRLRNPKAVEPLMKLLADENAFVRSATVDSLGMLRAREARVKIEELLLQDKDPQVRQQSAVSLSYLGDLASEDSLIKALGDEADGVRYAAARTLGGLHSRKAAPVLAGLLKDPIDGMRRAAAGALGQIRSKETAPQLLSALEDADAYVRREAVDALGVIGGEGVSEALKKRLDDADSIVRVNAALALHRGGDASGEPVVIKLLADEAVSVRQAAVNALGRIGSEKDGLEALEKAEAAEKHPGVKRAIQFAIAQLKARLGVSEQGTTP